MHVDIEDRRALSGCARSQSAAMAGVVEKAEAPRQIAKGMMTGRAAESA
jgi:hypothetical protein